jgi:hypothetical protein
MNIKNRDIFFKDFIQPVIIPILTVAVVIYLMHIGSQYYSINIINDLENELTKLGKLSITKKIKEDEPIPFLDYFKVKEDFHYKSILSISVLEIINEGIILLLLLLFLLGFSNLITITYKYQIVILIVLLNLKTIVSLTIPNIQTSIVEYLYLQFIKNNQYHFLFNQLNMVAIAMSIALIYTVNFILFGKPITLSIWHQITLSLVLTYKISKDIYNYKESLKKINEPRAINGIKYLVETVNKYALNISSELLSKLPSTNSIINNDTSQSPIININQISNMITANNNMNNNVNNNTNNNMNNNVNNNMNNNVNNNTLSINALMGNEMRYNINNEIDLESELMTSEQLRYLKEQAIDLFT